MIRATYRLQFHTDFPFREAMAHARYFADLGISHIYSSPILGARKGSRHGYDVIDHAHINPESGGEEDFRALCTKLREHGIGMILDIVPNHMAVGKADNPWWLDLLAKGPASRYAHYFDIDWDAPGLEGKILAPFLGEPVEQALAKGLLKLVREEGRWVFAYFDHRFPLRPEDQEHSPQSDPMAVLSRQHFVLADWREADARINWRRFFDITDLAALNANDAEVFEATHAKILSLYAEGLIDGVRVDHIDGIADPAAYCRRLRRRLDTLRPGAWILVEKILAEGESMPADWGIDGTTGYDFMNDVSALLHGEDGGRLEDLWQRRSGRGLSFEMEEQEARQEMLATEFASQRKIAVRALRKLLDHQEDELDAALTAVVARLRCYRSYATGKTGSPGAGSFWTSALRNAARDLPYLDPVFRALGNLLARSDGNPDVQEAIRHVSQLSAPVAAKAVEDTAFYRYGRILSRNDVGFDPRRQVLAVADFHARMAARTHWPNALLATATHDHKRGEDARARLAVLSRMPKAWEEFVAAAPNPSPVHPADAYHLYQTLSGAWPEDGADEAFAERILGWCTKYLREAKLRSSWTAPDNGYEDAFLGFARALILAPEHRPLRVRLEDLLAGFRKQAKANSLIQTVLRNTVPGIPDLYQGCEFEDLSLVDPDNRRPVDFSAREASLAAGDNPKQQAIARLLRLRRRDPRLWALGDYHPLLPEAPNLVAFSRNHGNASLIVVAALHPDLRPVPIHLARDYTDILRDKTVNAGMTTVAALLAETPVAVLFAN